MTHASYTRWLAGASLVASAAGSLSCGGVPVRTLACRDVAVYFDESEISESELLQALRAEHGVTDVKQRFSRRLFTGGRSRLSAVVLKMEQGSEMLTVAEWQRIKAGMETCHGVTGVERYETDAVRGAPRDLPWPVMGMTSTDVLEQPALQQMHVATASGTGEGVKVAVIDGGFDLSHAAIANSILGGYDAIDDDSDAQDLGNGIDDDGDGLIDEVVGHGTFGSGLIHAVAPDAKVIPIRVLDDEGHGTTLALWLGISAAVDAGADVINLSLVVSDMPPQLQAAIDAADAAGISIVTAAGNDPGGPAVNAYLAACASVVGSVDENSVDLEWSPLSSGITVYAPGKDLKGPIGGSGAKAGSYGYWDGTSFSTALVSGVAALIKQDAPGLTPQQVRARLKVSTTPVSGCDATAFGRIDAELATAE